ncbi:MAG: PorV/PorQ family protein [Elusimicrobia bacterium]|nr:PorV/PorQ family protein [Elusimicrobiota bacterium]
MGLLLAAFLSRLLGAPAAAYPGSTAANFLKVGVGARPVAMGQAFTAVSDDVNAVYYNPAGLALLERQEVSLMHNRYFDGVSQEWGAYAFPSAEMGTFAGGFTMLRVKPFDSYDVNDQPAGTVSAADLEGTLAYGREVPGIRGLTFGVALKHIASRLAGYHADADALDAGILWRQDPRTGWSWGVGVRNLGRDMRFIAESFPMPLEGRVAVAYRGGLAPLWNNASWLLTLEGVGSRDRTPYGQAGIEFRPVDAFAVRAGYDQGIDAGLGLSAGIGFKSLERGFVGDYFPEIDLDYAFVDYGPLNQTHRFSVTLRFGVPRPQRREGARREAAPFQELLRY